MSGPRGHLVTRSRWPAAFEAGTVGETVRSLCDQTCPAAEIVVVDDCSTDETADAAEAAGATIVRPPQNTGSKAGAQTFALDNVHTELVMAVDADTTLAPDAIELLLESFRDPQMTTACAP
jgi:poly-beta-1,6-N-acetyl-D-glucosamine synthase